MSEVLVLPPEVTLVMVRVLAVQTAVCPTPSVPPTAVSWVKAMSLPVSPVMVIVETPEVNVVDPIMSPELPVCILRAFPGPLRFMSA